MLSNGVMSGLVYKATKWQMESLFSSEQWMREFKP